MQKEYERAKAQAGDKEYRARHILVETEDQAKSLIAELKKGGKFDDLATKNSKDPGSAQRGGDLDWNVPGTFDKQFSDAHGEAGEGQVHRRAGAARASATTSSSSTTCARSKFPALERGQSQRIQPAGHPDQHRRADEGAAGESEGGVADLTGGPMARYGTEAQQKVKRAMHEAQARHAEERPLRQEGEEPQAGDRHRLVGGAPRRREGAAQKGESASPRAGRSSAGAPVPGGARRPARRSRSTRSSTPPTATSRTAAAWPGSSRAPPVRPCRPSPTRWWRRRGPLPTGSAVVTTAGKLPFKGVIHAVGPRYGEGDEERKLFEALANSFRLALEHGWDRCPSPPCRAASSRCRSRSAPAPTCKAARASPLRNVRLCLRDQPVIDAVLKEMKPR